MTNYDALLKFLETLSRGIDLIAIKDDLINNCLNDKIDSVRYQNVFLFEDLTLDFYLACRLKTAKDITAKLSETMKQLETSGLNTNIRDKWRQNIVNLIN
jgi:hypothetical protein